MDGRMKPGCQPPVSRPINKLAEEVRRLPPLLIRTHLPNHHKAIAAYENDATGGNLSNAKGEASRGAGDCVKRHAAERTAFHPMHDFLMHSVDARVEGSGEWATMPLLTNELQFVADAERERWRMVLKLHQGSYRPWVLVGPSAFLAAAGVEGDGLYAMRTFRGKRSRGITYTEGDAIGTYSGEVLAGPFASHESAEANREGVSAAQSGKDSLLWVKRAGGWVLVDGSTGEAPFLQKMNDARGAENNVTFKPSGLAFTHRTVPAADIVSAHTLADLAESELLVSYGASFWRLHTARVPEHLPYAEGSQ